MKEVQPSHITMASLARAARFMVLLQIALFVVSAVIMSGSVCHEVGTGPDALDPSHRPICGGRPCGQRGLPYGGRPWSPSAVRWRDWATMIIAAQVATTTLLNQPGV
uniref:Uncharacterized protein n=1 Tax=Triticum urartu TaxID=4572 RepID=A0A8R7R3N0_TRIUA